MEFKHLQSFVAVVKNKSFTKAAEDLFISQPTISAHISQLEEELGKRLILRTTKSISITPKGQEIYEYALSILDLKNRIIETCSSRSRNIIHIGASTIPSAYILPEILPEYGKCDPHTYFVIHQGDSAEIANGIKEGLFDIGLVGINVEDDAIECIPFCENKMILITPVNEYFLNLLAEKDLSVETLLKQPVILREKGSGSKKSADRLMEKLGISESDLHVTARINDQEAIKNLVAGGLGISIISEMAARNYLAERRILGFSLDQYANTRTFYIIYRKGFILPDHLQDFIKYILSNPPAQA